jgi:hypothetical protein
MVVDSFHALGAAAYMDITGNVYVPTYLSQTGRGADQASTQGGRAAVGNMMGEAYTDLATLGVRPTIRAVGSAANGDLEPLGMVAGSAAGGRVMYRMMGPAGRQPRFPMMQENILSRRGVPCPPVGRVVPRAEGTIDIAAVRNVPNAYIARWILGADSGGMSFKVFPGENMVSIDSMARGGLPPRSAGSYAAATLIKLGISRPKIIEAYNVIEAGTLEALRAGRGVQGTRIMNMLENMVNALGGRMTRVEIIQDGARFDIRVHIEY